MSKYVTIKQAAADPTCPIHEGTLRRLVKNGEVPGFYSGNRFWLDFAGLLEVVAQKTRPSVKQEAAAK